MYQRYPSGLTHLSSSSLLRTDFISSFKNVFCCHSILSFTTSFSCTCDASSLLQIDYVWTLVMNILFQQINLLSNTLWIDGLWYTNQSNLSYISRFFAWITTWAVERGADAIKFTILAQRFYWTSQEIKMISFSEGESSYVISTEKEAVNPVVALHVPQIFGISWSPALLQEDSLCSCVFEIQHEISPDTDSEINMTWFDWYIRVW